CTSPEGNYDWFAYW
nr:immunoglobulin heavy chain junction region [Mus musculus]